LLANRQALFVVGNSFLRSGGRRRVQASKHAVLVRRFRRRWLPYVPCFRNTIPFEAKDMDYGDLRHIRLDADSRVNGYEISFPSARCISKLLFGKLAAFSSMPARSDGASSKVWVMMPEIWSNMSLVCLAHLTGRGDTQKGQGSLLIQLVRPHRVHSFQSLRFHPLCAGVSPSLSSGIAGTRSRPRATGRSRRTASKITGLLRFSPAVRFACGHIVRASSSIRPA
jgi:hypothetical protein